MVSISGKTATKRVATAKCTIRFSNPTAVVLIRENQMKKGDVLGVARVAGIMAAKRTWELIPLCHPIAISHVSVELETVDPTALQDGERPGDREGVGGRHGQVDITATVGCDDKTGVEMEALTAASVAALTVYDMCKALDKGMVVDGLRLVLKEGGKSGRWVQGTKTY
jgi:cyclic pyranopterin phosphate synthase